VSEAIAGLVDAIDYPNFKDSIDADDPDRHSAFSDVWSVLVRWFGAYGRPGRVDQRKYEAQTDLVDAYLHGNRHTR
jgi:hypothetical protein